MARPRRQDAEGAWHHVMHRGARREAIFRSDEHCLLFLRSLDEAVERFGLEVHAYALMPNHYHLLARTPRANLSRAMRHVNSTYTQRLNLRHGWDGALFRGRFRSQLVEEERYLDHLFAYVHLNPFRARLARRLDEPCWTSLRAYLGVERAPGWLETRFFTERFGGAAAIAEVVRAFRKGGRSWPAALDLDSGWLRGVDASASPGARAVAMNTADGVLRAVAEIAGCPVTDLKRAQLGRGANPARRLAVWALAQEQAYSHGEIGAVLGMSEGQVGKVLSRLRRDRAAQPLASWMEVVQRRGKVESGGT